jgi:uncharacterized protein (TIGR00251 family)
MSDAIEVRVRARAARDELAGFRDGRLQVRVTAPPLEGRANKVVRKLIARRMGVAPSRVTIVRGQRSRDKLVRVEGMSAPEVRAALGQST